MKVSIIIPYYRAYDSLNHLLFALCEQDTSFDLKNDVEIIIINDELENPLEIENFKYPQLNLRILNKINEGVASARNLGIKSAAGAIILFLDQDCYPKQNWLNAMLSRFNKGKQIDAIGGKIIPQTNGGIVNEYYNFINRLEKPIIDKQTGKIIAIITANSGFKLSVLKSVDGFDEKAFYKCAGGEDIDLSFRLKKAGYLLGYEPSAIVYHKYPTAFKTIFFKFANYGKGVAIHCKINKINSKNIKQPARNLLGFLIYYAKIFILPINRYKKYAKTIKIKKIIVFVLFDIVRYFAHGFGFFFPWLV